MCVCVSVGVLTLFKVPSTARTVLPGKSEYVALRRRFYFIFSFSECVRVRAECVISPPSCASVCEKTPIDACAFVLVVSLRKQIIESQKLHRWRVQYVRACHSECASSIRLRRRHLSPRASPPPWEKENEIVDIHHRELGNRCA